MPKPGQQTNIASPERSASSGITDAASVGQGSHQNASTTQQSSNPNRMRPLNTSQPRAQVERNEVMDNQTSDKSSSTRTVYGKRRAIFSGTD